MGNFLTPLLNILFYKLADQALLSEIADRWSLSQVAKVGK